MVVGAGVMIRGDIGGLTDVHVHGQVVGKVAVADLVVGARGLIDGPVTGHAVLISGCVLGPIDARSVELSASARVEGDVTCESLQIEPGARFVGRCIPKDLDQDKIVPIFGHRDDGPPMADAARELLSLAASLRRLRE